MKISKILLCIFFLFPQKLVLASNITDEYVSVKCPGKSFSGAIVECGKILKDLHLNRRVTAKAYYNRGYAYYRLSQYDKSIVNLNQAIRFHEGYLLAHFYRGISYVYLEGEKPSRRRLHIDQGLKDLSYVISEIPDLSEAYTKRAILYSEKKLYHMAIKDLSIAIKIDPTSYNYAVRGSVHETVKQYKKAMIDLNKAIQIQPDNSTAYAFRGSLYRSMGKREKSKGNLKKENDFLKKSALDFEKAKYFGARELQRLEFK